MVIVLVLVGIFISFFVFIRCPHSFDYTIYDYHGINSKFIIYVYINNCLINIRVNYIAKNNKIYLYKHPIMIIINKVVINMINIPSG